MFVVRFCWNEEFELSDLVVGKNSKANAVCELLDSKGYTRKGKMLETTNLEFGEYCVFTPDFYDAQMHGEIQPIVRDSGGKVLVPSV